LLLLPAVAAAVSGRPACSAALLGCWLG
jgi:hypothetical protein